MVSNPLVRPAQRPHHLAAGHAPALDAHRSGRRHRSASSSVAVAPNIAVVLVGWCIAQVFFNALLAAQVAVLPDQVPVPQRGLVVRACSASACRSPRWPAPSWCRRSRGTRARHVPGAVCGRRPFVVAVRRPAPRPSARPGGQAAVVAARARRHVLRQPPPQPGLRLGVPQPVHARAWPTRSWSPTRPTTCSTSSAAPRTTYRTRSTSARSSSRSPSSSRHLVGRPAVRPGRAPQGLRRRAPRVVYAAAMFVIATADGLGGYLVGMAIGGLGFGMYMAVDLALVVDVLPDTGSAAKDLGVLNIAGALPVRPRAGPRTCHPRARERQLRGPVRRRRRLRAGRCGRHPAGQGGSASRPWPASSALSAASGNDEGRERAPCHFQRIAPRGACGKAPVMPQTSRPCPERGERGVRWSM